MRPIRVGVVGCGGIARGLHLPVISALPDVLELVAVCDKDKALASQTGKKYGVEHFADIEKLLEQDVEAVSVLTHAYTHHILGRLAAEAGKHVLVEKPIAITLSCADSLIRACEKAKVVLEVAENYPFMPMDALINKVSRWGCLGKVAAVYVRDDLNGISLDIGVTGSASCGSPFKAGPCG
jgi:predicted dehydrogenase